MYVHVHMRVPDWVGLGRGFEGGSTQVHTPPVNQSPARPVHLAGGGRVNGHILRLLILGRRGAVFVGKTRMARGLKSRLVTTREKFGFGLTDVVLFLSLVPIFGWVLQQVMAMTFGYSFVFGPLSWVVVVMMMMMEGTRPRHGTG